MAFAEPFDDTGEWLLCPPDYSADGLIDIRETPRCKWRLVGPVCTYNYSARGCPGTCEHYDPVGEGAV